METIKTAGDMSKEQTALERIKDEVAKEKGYMEWSNLFGANPEIFNQVCERYARECCQATESAIGNLLAVMHGDGGHYQQTHGTVKAIEDAQELLYKKWKSISQVEDSCQATLERAASNVRHEIGSLSAINKESITNKDNIVIL